MPAVQSKVQRLWNRIAVVLVLAVLVIMMIPLYWIGSTAFKDRADATTVPPTVFFKPEITAFIKLFTSRVERRGAPDKEMYAKAPWWEKQVMDGGERFIRDDKGNIVSSGYVGRFLNSIIIAVTSTFLAVAMGTLTAYGFSRFKMPGESDWLFLHPFHAYVASGRCGYSHVSHVSRRGVGRHALGTDHPLHSVQSLVLGLGYEGLYG